METRYIGDENGKRMSAILPIEEYEHVIESLGDLEDARGYDKAKAELERGEDKLVPWEKVRREIESEYEEPAG